MIEPVRPPGYVWSAAKFLLRRLQCRCIPFAVVLLPSLVSGQRDTGAPDAVRFITDDIAHFWEAFDARGILGTGRALDSLYFGRASAVLHDFRRLRLPGYRIARAWFARQPDERVALKRLMALDGLAAARTLVDDSGYDPS